MNETTPVEKTQRHRAGAANTVSRPPRILVAEADAGMRALLANMLRRDGYVVIECCNGRDLLALVYLYGFSSPTKPDDIDLIISDIRRPGFTGLEALQITEVDGCPPIVMMTAFGDKKTYAQARHLRADARLRCVKGFSVSELMAEVRELAKPLDLALRGAGATCGAAGVSSIQSTVNMWLPRSRYERSVDHVRQLAENR